MRITRLRLRNYRVYEDELELELPPGLVGVYGANGAGKSTLLESIGFALYGRARTGKDDIRTAGVNGEALAEVEFEHEGHLYVVRRTISGINHTVKAQAYADGAHISEGVRDTTRYVHSVLGMDEAAFRASVFAEQNQIAAFSDTAPAERRRLVLQLLGVTPLDGARDAARKDAKAAREGVDRMRALLPGLAEIQEEIAEAADRLAKAEAAALDSEERVTEARGLLVAATERYEQLDQVGRRYERLIRDGKAARDEREGLAARQAKLEAELDGLIEAAGRLEELRAAADRREPLERELQLVETALQAVAARDAVDVPAQPEPVDEDALAAARELAAAAAARLAAIDGELAASRSELERARAAVDRSATLSGEADCPLCGQALGESFAQVQSHRAAERHEAESRVSALESERRLAAEAKTTTAREADRTEQAHRQSRQAWSAWQLAAERRADAAAAAERAVAECGGDPPDRDRRDRLAVERENALRAAAEVARLEGRLMRREAADEELTAARQRTVELDRLLHDLRAEVKGLGFDPAELDAAKVELGRARLAAEDADRKHAAAAQSLAAARVGVAAEEKRLDDARRQHDRLAGAEDDARHLGRVADLIQGFRNSVVATVGPRLSAQAADLFGELTDHEYDLLKVDPDTYEIQIQDAGRLYDMDRFSGSETDLANLALRVAISEHVRFQSGGAVGLLVLDEVFGPLDDERRERMLLALERLRGRFRQVLVVTHANEVKEQLPAAIEVRKLAGRRAIAQLMNG